MGENVQDSLEQESMIHSPADSFSHLNEPEYSYINIERLEKERCLLDRLEENNNSEKDSSETEDYDSDTYLDPSTGVLETKSSSDSGETEHSENNTNACIKYQTTDSTEHYNNNTVVEQSDNLAVQTEVAEPDTEEPIEARTHRRSQRLSSSSSTVHTQIKPCFVVLKDISNYKKKVSEDMSEDNQGPLSTELSTDSMDASDVVQDSAGLRVSTPAGATPPMAASPGVPALPRLRLQSSGMQTRRSSTRAVKRKKFDDELVESSLIKSDRGRLKPPDAKPDAPLPTQPVVPAVVEEPTAPPPPPPAPVAPPPPPPEKKKHSKSASKRSKKPKPPGGTAAKDLGRWKPQDDLALVTAVQQTCDLTAVHLGVKFSCKFTLKEIQERWYALLYDPIISKLAISAMQQLHPDVVANVQAKALYGKEEEKLLGSISSTSQPTIDQFQALLDDNAEVFYPTRTPKALFNHWLLMKQYHLLPDQSVQPMPRGDHVLTFSDAEDMINDDELKDPRDEILEHELSVADRRNKKEVRHLEQELPKWQVLVDSVTGISPPDFDNQTLAVLRGRLVRYLMRSREITLGRATKDNQIDVDLSLEGPAWKISRRQGMIKLRNNGDFYIANEGKRPIYIDGKPVLTGNKQKLNNNSVVEISCLRFIFLINQDLISVIRTEAQKMTS